MTIHPLASAGLPAGLVPLSLGLLALVASPSASAAVSFTQVAAENDIIVSSPFFFVASQGDPEINSDGGYALRRRTGSSFGDNYGMNPAVGEDFIQTSVAPGPGTLQYQEQDAQNLPPFVIGTRSFQWTEFRDTDIDNAGNVAIGAFVSFTDTAGDDRTVVQSLWLDQTPLAIAGDPLTAPGLTDQDWIRINLGGMGETGIPIYTADYGTYAPSGPKATSNSTVVGTGVFAGAGTRLLASGDPIGNTADTVLAGESGLSNLAVSLDGNDYLVAASRTSGGDYAVINGVAQEFLFGGAVLDTDAVIGTANGALDASETLGGLLGNPAVGGGNWGFTTFTSEPTGERDGVAMINGYATFRELDGVLDTTLTPRTLDGAAEGMAFNSDGDVVVAFDNALILNGTVILYSGDPLAGGTFNAINSGLAISDRDTNGEVEIYFNARKQFSSDDTIFRADGVFNEGALAGDMNLDGVTDDLDVEAFATAYLSLYQYAGRYGSAADARGDFNADGLVDDLDIPAFAALAGVSVDDVYAAIPQPGSAVLLLPGLFGLAFRPRSRRVAG